jgi:uncharacterized membrane protein YraQ (UPF0718 family)
MNNEVEKLGKRPDLLKNAGRLFLNIGQLIFGSIFLGSVIKGNLPQMMLMLGGLFVALLFFIAGLLLTSPKGERT